MHTFGRDGKHTTGYPNLDKGVLSYIVGPEVSMSLGSFIRRVNKNNERLDQSRMTQTVAEVEMYGLKYLSRGDMDYPCIIGAVKATEVACKNLRKAHEAFAILTFEVLEEFLNNLCLHLYRDGLCTDGKRTGRLLDLSAFYLTDVLWFSPEKPLVVDHSTVRSKGTWNQKTVDYSTESTEMTALLATDENVVAPDNATGSQASKSSKPAYRWYSESLTALVQFVGRFTDAIAKCRSGNIPVATEVFPPDCRVGYSGPWLLNGSQGESATDSKYAARDMVYGKFNMHNMHPARLLPRTQDLSVPQVIGTFTSSNDCTSVHRASGDCNLTYFLGRDLCKVISMNRYRLNRIHSCVSKGGEIVTEYYHKDRVLYLFMNTCWMALKPSSKSNLQRTQMLAIIEEYVGVAGYRMTTAEVQYLKSKVDSLISAMQHVAVLLQDVYECIQGQIKMMIQSLTCKKFCSLYRQIVRKSKYHANSKFLSYIEDLVVEQFTDIATITSTFFQPSINSVLMERIRNLSTELKRVPYERLPGKPSGSTLFTSFNCMSSAEISKLSQGEFENMMKSCTKGERLRCFHRCIDLKQVDMLASIATTPFKYLTADLKLDNFRRYGSIFSNQANHSITELLHPLISQEDTYETLLLLQAFVYTPYVTRRLLYRFMDAFVSGSRDSDQPSMFELCNSVWSTQIAWDILDSKYSVCKKVTDMTNFEYILYCIENIKQPSFLVDSAKDRKVCSRRYYSKKMVLEEGSQPEVLFSLQDGQLTDMPEDYMKHFDELAEYSDTFEYSDLDEDEDEEDDEDEEEDEDEDEEEDDPNMYYTGTALQAASPRVKTPTFRQIKRNLSADSSSPTKRHKSSTASSDADLRSSDAGISPDSSNEEVPVRNKTDPHIPQELIAESVYRLLYNRVNVPTLPDVNTLHAICIAKDGKMASLLLALIMSKIAIRKCSENLMMETDLIECIMQGLLSMKHLPQEKTWIPIAVALNLYRVCLYDTSYLVCKRHELGICLNLWKLPNFSLQMISVQQLTMFQRSYSTGSVIDLAPMMDSVDLEYALSKYSGIAFRFLDFVRFYALPITTQEKGLLVRMLGIILSLSEKVSTRARHPEDDFDRNLLHHIVDIGMAEDVTVDMLRYCKTHVPDRVDFFGRNTASLLQDAYAAYYKVANLF